MATKLLALVENQELTADMGPTDRSNDDGTPSKIRMMSPPSLKASFRLRTHRQGLTPAGLRAIAADGTKCSAFRLFRRFGDSW